MLVRTIRKASREMVRELGLLELPAMTMPRCHALIELADRGSMTVAQLAEVLRLDKSTTSRVVSRLEKEGLIQSRTNAADRRQKPLFLTESGQVEAERLHQQSDLQVGAALATLSATERHAVQEGLAIYAKALARARRRKSIVVRPIRLEDNEEIARIIRAVLTEYGANKPGFAFMDPELDCMFQTYAGPGSAYLVVEWEGKVVGGGGFAPLKGGPADVCELQKMYFLEQTRGLGLGAQILAHSLDEAAKAGYRGCYLETLGHMERAVRLYRSFGFKPLSKAMGSTGHCGCNSYYYKDLEPVTSLVEI